MKLENFDFSKKIFYHPDRVNELKSGGRPFPVTVEIDLTNQCNHRCSFCFYAEHIATDRSTLNTDVIIKTLTELKDCGTRGVSFTGGGEPMLHKDYIKILEHAATIGLDCGLITNGSAIHSKNVESLVKHLTWIRISIAGGDQESYEKVQGINHFEKIIGNIALMQATKEQMAGRVNIGARMLVTPENVTSVPNLAKLLGDIGINYIQVAPDQFTTDKGAFWDGPLAAGYFTNAELYLKTTPTKLLTSGYVWYQDQIEKPSACYAHFFQIAILAEGHVAFCKNARGEENFYIGNINENSMQEIWEDTVNKDIESWVKPSNCGMYCKHIQMNLALEDVVNPDFDMSINFVG
ncbi:radical SAM protein [Dasania marina]|uniref:radical SAM protein n=1 Tax=Dasania marina TaxID=471499 RepID=UPI0003730FAB|nr:radical SAM protein [Dasania marina]